VTGVQTCALPIFIESSYAKVAGGLGALSLVKRAREHLLAAEKLDATALDGSVYTSLGSLYAKVPGWPIGFGDKKKARAYLEQALALNPDGIDPNYFYGELLIDSGERAAGRARLEKALLAAPRPGREDADAGRRAEIEALLARSP
jgi:tetratricopeptide (TPR) repeat protein